jgi:transposase
MDEKVIQRFWGYVDVRGNDECWEWKGPINKTRRGYGELSTGPGHTVHLSAHRLSYEIHYGPIPDGLFICHHCDNPPCVNPHHLFAGTHQDNMRDAAAKGRLVIPNASKLSVNQVRAIRIDPRKLREIAAEYDVSMSVVSRIRRGKLWGWVEWESPMKQTMKQWGQENGNSKLTADQAAAILNDPRKYREIADEYGISYSTVSSIKMGRRWGSIA